MASAREVDQRPVTERMSFDAALKVACPSCGAAPGHRCRNIRPMWRTERGSRIRAGVMQGFPVRVDYPKGTLEVDPHNARRWQLVVETHDPAAQKSPKEMMAMTINNGDPDISEFDQHVGRSGRPYSLGHRIMYETPIKLFGGSPQHILDIGFGIGYGLKRMLEEKVIASYVGFEPDEKSFRHVSNEFGIGSPPLQGPSIFLIRGGFPPDDVQARVIPRNLQQAFLIEVIEHIPLDEHVRFLAAVRRVLPDDGTLWMSTPDLAKNEHGARSVGPFRALDGWLSILHRTGFRNVTVHAEQWTTLYICQ